MVLKMDSYSDTIPHPGSPRRPRPSPLKGEGRVPALRLTDRSFRRKLRREQTETERKLWSLLRSRRLEKYKFGRQHTIGPYIADFCCLERKMIIELDGDQHAEQVARDEKRTAFLESKGYSVLRFWDNQVFKETDAVMEMILAQLETAPAAVSVRAKAYGWNG